MVRIDAQTTVRDEGIGEIWYAQSPGWPLLRTDVITTNVCHDISRTCMNISAYCICVHIHIQDIKLQTITLSNSTSKTTLLTKLSKKTYKLDSALSNFTVTRTSQLHLCSMQRDQLRPESLISVQISNTHIAVGKTSKPWNSIP